VSADTCPEYLDTICRRVFIAHGVRWHEATTVARELGCTLFLEVPPGHVLTDLILDSFQDVKAYPVTPERTGRNLRLAQQEQEVGTTW